MTDRRCTDCIFFRRDDGHPVHAGLCVRPGERLLSADAERSLPAPSCGPEAQFFQSKETAP